MSKIPEEIKREMENDPFYKKCCIGNHECSGRVEWHHNLIYKGKQVQEKWCILPVCHYHHEHEKDTELGEMLDFIMLSRATQDDLKRFSKVIDYTYQLARLSEIYEYHK